jgi:hypothetical protein
LKGWKRLLELKNRGLSIVPKRGCGAVCRFSVASRAIVGIGLSILSFFSMLSAGQILSSHKISTVCDSAQYLLVRQKYSQASKLIQAYLNRVPNDIDAMYLSFAIEQTRILDYESYLIDCKKYQVFAESLKNTFEKRLPTLHGDDSVVCLFYLANVYGGLSIVQAKTGNWFDAVKNAVPSVSLLKDVRLLEPDFYAAYLGLGVFNYYLKNSFKWLPFIDDKEDDLKTLETALNASFPYDYAAKNTLCWILIEKNQYKRSDSLALTVLKEVPDNTIFLRIRLMIALWTQQYKTALYMADRFIKMTLERQPRNWSDLVAGYSVLIDSYEAIGDISSMNKAINSILQMNIPEGFAAIPHVKKSLKKINDQRIKCKNVQ